MDKAVLEEILKSVTTTVDEAMQKGLKDVVEPTVIKECKRVIEEMRLEKALYGKDKTGLSDDQKSMFMNTVKAAAGFKTKANEIISEQDSSGGYLIAREVESAILRIAASVGLVMSQATKWSMGTDEKAIPAYTGSFLEGEFLGVNAAGTNTAVNFGQAVLLIKKWQLAFVVANDLMEDSSVEFANWLLALAGEALANMVDKQGIAGNGTPFIGILNKTGVTVYNLGGTATSGKTAFDDVDLDDFSDMIGSVEESILDGASFGMSRTVWAKVRVMKDANDNYILPMAGAASAGVLTNNPTGGGLRIAGEILGYPVFTNRHYPAFSTSAVSTKFMTFGNMKALAYGERSGMTVEQYKSGAFGGKEIALADQRAMVYKKRFALTVALPAAFVVAKTDAS